ncbi:MAG: GYD domain-containing protein [Oceanospirillaceae bacterium]
MAHFLVQISFTADAIAKLVATPENRLEKVIPVVQALGGSFVGSWLSFGEYDSAAIIEMPDNVSAKAFSMAAMAGGALKDFHMTPLMSFEDGVEAMKKAGALNYVPPAES